MMFCAGSKESKESQVQEVPKLLPNLLAGGAGSYSFSSAPDVWNLAVPAAEGAGIITNIMVSCS